MSNTGTMPNPITCGTGTISKPVACDTGRLSDAELNTLFGSPPSPPPTPPRYDTTTPFDKCGITIDIPTTITDRSTVAIPLPDNSKSNLEKIYSQDEISALLSDMSGTAHEPKPDESQTTERYGDPVEILSQEEMENIMNMMGNPAPAPNTCSCCSQLNKRHWQVDDASIERVSKHQMRQLQKMHNQFARRIAAKISNMLQAVVDVKLVSIDELCYSEFIFGLDNPTCFSLLQVKTPHGDENMVLDISPSILFIMIERMLGGGREPHSMLRRPLSNIEVRLAQRIIGMVLEELKTTWQKIAELDFTVTQTESNPQMIQVVEPNEAVVVLCFEVVLIGISGCMTFCIPVDVFEQLTVRPLSHGVMEAFDVFAKANKTYDYGEFE